MVKLNDITIGNFPITQLFGVNPAVYNWIKDAAGNPIHGHNGIDLGVPTGTILLNPFPKEDYVTVSFVGFEQNGYGNYVRLWNQSQHCVILYGHCQEISVKQGAVLYFQQQVAVSNNTGWSSGPHTHVGLYQVDDQGNKINRDNGFDGYQNLLDPQVVQWVLFNPIKAAEPPQAQQPVVDSPDLSKYPKFAADFEKLVTIADHFQRVADFLKVAKHVDSVTSDEIIGDITALAQKENDVTITLLRQDVANKKEENDRLHTLLDNKDQIHETDIKALKATTPSYDEFRQDFTDRYNKLQQMFDEVSKEKGNLLMQLKASQADKPAPSTLFDKLTKALWLHW